MYKSNLELSARWNFFVSDHYSQKTAPKKELARSEAVLGNSLLESPGMMLIKIIHWAVREFLSLVYLVYGEYSAFNVFECIERV